MNPPNNEVWFYSEKEHPFGVFSNFYTCKIVIGDNPDLDPDTGDPLPAEISCSKRIDGTRYLNKRYFIMGKKYVYYGDYEENKYRLTNQERDQYDKTQQNQRENLIRAGEKYRGNLVKSANKT